MAAAANHMIERDRHGRNRPTVGAGWPRAFLDFSVVQGADRCALLARSGIRQQDLEHQDNRVPLEGYIALIEAGIDLTQQPALALRFGETVRMEDVTIVALIGAASETVGECFSQIGRFARLMIDAGESDALAPSEIVREDNGLWIVTSDNMFCSNRYLEQVSLAQNFCGWRRIMQLPISPNTLVHVLQDEPPYRDEFERIIGAPIVFGAGRNAVRVEDDFLDLRFPAPNRYVFGLLSERAHALIQELESVTSTRAEVERHLSRILHTGDVAVDGIARKMALSRKTLYRRLKAEGLTFEGVLDDLRRRLALSYLADRKVSVTETAYLVGFSDPAAFSRAFKRWTGASPSSFLATKFPGKRASQTRP
jgi:AraC-like DNA-binding protein